PRGEAPHDVVHGIRIDILTHGDSEPHTRFETKESEDVLIVDATDRLGWLAGRLLADLGAEVIKIEARGSDRSSSQWRACNVNKRVLELEPESAAEQEHLEEL